MPDRRRYERSPDTLALLASLAIGGALLTVFNVVPASVAAIAPPGVALAWSATLSLGAGVALAGVVARSPTRGWGLEAIGRGCLAPILLGYAVALASAASNAGTWFLIVMFVALAAASAARCYQTVRRLGEFRAALRKVLAQ